MASNSTDKSGAALDGLAEKLGHRFTDSRSLQRALTHSSASGAAGAQGSYERLEFLGDRVLGLVVADLLLRRFPEESEGSLAKRFAYLVSGEILSQVARDIGLGEFIAFSRGEADAGGSENPAILADVMEAVIAALYRDGGLEAARGFIEPQWRPLVEADLKPPREPKTALQEWAQGQGLPLPRYEEVGRDGPAHDPRFSIRVVIERKGGTLSGEGEGRSKRMAEQAAASALLEQLEKEQAR
ncbi:MAG: ribonuclease III [Limibacillus sp.]|jgi:ribonuclease III